MKTTAAFIMPVKISGDDVYLNFFKASVRSIINQTDKDWILVMIDDYSDNKKTYEIINEFKEELKDKLHIIYTDKNYGTGVARNKGVKYAYDFGAPFILFNDSDDISNPRRLELVRKAFEDETVNLVYTSFDVIDENDNIVPPNKINKTIEEIIDGHKVDIVEGEKSWAQIAMKKKYTNLTSCTAARTTLAIQEPFPSTSVSEDCHTWFRYGAHPGKFYFIKDIKGGYRICSNVASRSRAEHSNFYEKMFSVDTDGFEQAMKLAKKHGTMIDLPEEEIRAAFHVRLALCLLHGGSIEYCQKSLKIAVDISKEITEKYIDLLYCEEEDKLKLKEIVNDLIN